MLSLICLIHIHLEEVTKMQRERKSMRGGDEGVRHSVNPLSTFNHIKRLAFTVVYYFNAVISYCGTFLPIAIFQSTISSIQAFPIASSIEFLRVKSLRLFNCDLLAGYHNAYLSNEACYVLAYNRATIGQHLISIHSTVSLVL